MDHWDTVLAACQYRMEQMIADRRIKFVLLFENHGEAAGASRAHAHFQIIGLPVMPLALTHKLLNAREFFIRHDHCLFCAVLERELRDQKRIVIEDDAFVTYAPWASRIPYELRVMPRPHHASFLEIPQAQRRRLAAHMRSVLYRLDGLFGDVPYNWVLHTIPTSEVDPRVFHWHIEILPRLAIQGGYEWGSGSFINSTAPEAAAVDLRAAAGD
jgi:UDPglucose--hexose-1-phosphate uridylyltransferase